MNNKHSSHSEDKKNAKKVLIIFFVLLLIIFSSIFFITNFNKKKNNEKPQTDNSSESSSNIGTLGTEPDPFPDAEPIVVNNDEVPNQLGDYNILGTLVIDKINLKQYILDSSDEETLNSALSLSATKFYGPSGLNNPGNFCIAGHNYKNIFGYLNKLNVDDTFYIVDKLTSRKVTYKIYNKYTVYPDDLDCLDQATNDEREVTLITCTPGKLTRLIIKAKEI